MKATTQEIWDKFDRWSQRYLTSGQRVIERMLRKGYSTALAQIPFASADEFLRDLDIIEDLGYTEEMLQNRLHRRIDFLSKYLVDISFDGPEFMQKKSEFIWDQKHGENKTLFSIWLIQDDTNHRGRKQFEPSGHDISFFCNDINQVDLSSMRSAYPYDIIHAWHPNMKPWDAKMINNFINNIEEDLSFDYEVNIEVVLSNSGKRGHSSLEVKCNFHI